MSRGFALLRPASRRSRSTDRCPCTPLLIRRRRATDTKLLGLRCSRVLRPNPVGSPGDSSRYLCYCLLPSRPLPLPGPLHSPRSPFCLFRSPFLARSSRPGRDLSSHCAIFATVHFHSARFPNILLHVVSCKLFSSPSEANLDPSHDFCYRQFSSGPPPPPAWRTLGNLDLAETRIIFNSRLVIYEIILFRN